LLVGVINGKLHYLAVPANVREIRRFSPQHCDKSKNRRRDPALVVFGVASRYSIAGVGSGERAELVRCADASFFV
jgi:hypothetical protein